MSWIFWWAADAYRQPETRGCLSDFMLILGLMALAMLIYTLIWGG
jgi:hypothetical protein